YICKASYATATPPKSPIFSPLVNLPLTKEPFTGSYSSYCAASCDTFASKFLRSASVHQFFRFPSPSNLEPPSSKPCEISCPITAPIPPKLTAGSALKLKKGG